MTPAGNTDPEERWCAWCETSRLEGRRDAIYCSTKCRQASWRFGVKPAKGEPYDHKARRIAYADPPYPGKAKYYKERKEVNQPALLRRLMKYDGWALSTNQTGLRKLLPIAPRGTRVAVWIRSHRSSRSARALSAWEPLLYFPARALATAKTQGVKDVLVYGGQYRAYPGRVVGTKPPQFTVWMLELLAARRGDAFTDLYPGSGAVTRAWNRRVKQLDG